MPRVAGRILSVIYWTFVAVMAIAMFPVAVLVWILTLPFDRRLRALHLLTCFWASLYTWCSPVWRVKVRGREKIDPRRTYVMVSNHLSLVDIFVLFRLFVHYKWVSKIENFKLPFIGWNMYLNRYVALRRGDKTSVLAMFEACERALGSGSSIMMFPEGTRSRTGQLKAFKPGAFEIALKTGMPVLPIALQGTFDALPAKGFTVRPARITVTVLDPIEPATFAGDTPEALAERVRGIIADAMEQ